MLAILFDLDETLVPDIALTDAAVASTCWLAAAERGVDASSLARSLADEAESLWRAGPAFAYADAIGIAWWEGLWARFDVDEGLAALREWAAEYRIDAWSRALSAAGADDPTLPTRLADRFGAARRLRHGMFAEAPAVLARLRTQHRLALITNGATDLQREKIEGAGLADSFETVVISGALGIGKPDPRIFAHALDALGVEASDALMVGDSLERDIAGARASGIRAVWVDRAGLGATNGRRDRGVVEPPIERIADLGELPSVVQRLE